MKTKIIIVGILVGFIAFPAIALGGSFVSSLIQGKTVEQAIQILVEQTDALIGRVEVVETKQGEQEEKTKEMQSTIDQQKTLIDQLQSRISANKACSDMYRYFKSDVDAEHFYKQALEYQQIHGVSDPQAQEWLNEYQLYLQAKQKCDLLSK